MSGTWKCSICGERHPSGTSHADTLVKPSRPPGEPRWPDKSWTTDETSKGFREFSSGASRDTAIGKLDVARYIHPLVIKRFAEYMLEKQEMPDGTTRSGDNWTKGIPPQELLSSLERHNLDIWLHMKGECQDAEESIENALLGAWFNIMAMILHNERDTLK